MKAFFKNIWQVLITPYHYSESILTARKERIQSFDIIRGLAIIFMVLIHIFSTYGTIETNVSVVGEIVDFLGGPPTAPVFIFLMGALFILSSKSNYKQKFFRGLGLIALGFVLNVCRGFIPYHLATTYGFISLNQVKR